jgi:hypothetical protein
MIEKVIQGDGVLEYDWLLLVQGGKEIECQTWDCVVW